MWAGGRGRGRYMRSNTYIWGSHSSAWVCGSSLFTLLKKMWAGGMEEVSTWNRTPTFEDPIQVLVSMSLHFSHGWKRCELAEERRYTRSNTYIWGSHCVCASPLVTSLKDVSLAEGEKYMRSNTYIWGSCSNVCTGVSSLFTVLKNVSCQKKGKYTR